MNNFGFRGLAAQNAEGSRSVSANTAAAVSQALVHVQEYGVRLCLWTAATKGSIVHLSGDIWEWRNMVE
jgi:hypothetical protein